MVINSRTGTIVISSVRLAPRRSAMAPWSGSMKTRPWCSRTARGQTALEPNSTITARQQDNVVSRVGPGASLAEVVDALNARAPARPIWWQSSKASSRRDADRGAGDQ